MAKLVPSQESEGWSQTLHVCLCSSVWKHKGGGWKPKPGKKKIYSPILLPGLWEGCGWQKNRKGEESPAVIRVLKSQTQSCMEAKDVSYSKQVLGISHWSMRGLHTCKTSVWPRSEPISPHEEDGTFTGYSLWFPAIYFHHKNNKPYIANVCCLPVSSKRIIL